MLELLFTIFMFGIFGKLFFFGLRAAWGIARILLTVVFLPVILVLMVIGGLISVAFPILLIIGLISMITSKN